MLTSRNATRSRLLPALAAALLLSVPFALTGCSGEATPDGGARPSTSLPSTPQAPADEPTCPPYIWPTRMDDRSHTTIRDEVIRIDAESEYGCVSFRGARLIDVTFEDLSVQPDFRGATLIRVTFKGGIITFADFRRATLRQVRFLRTGLLSVSFGGSTQVGVRFVNVTCPSGVPSRDNGGDCEGNI